MCIRDRGSLVDSCPHLLPSRSRLWMHGQICCLKDEVPDATLPPLPWHLARAPVSPGVPLPWHPTCCSYPYCLTHAEGIPCPRSFSRPDLSTGFSWPAALLGWVPQLWIVPSSNRAPISLCQIYQVHGFHRHWLLETRTPMKTITMRCLFC